MTRAARWRVLVRAGDPWTAHTWTRVATAVQERQPIHASKHATTYRWTDEDRSVFVKVYHPYRRLTMLKDLVRPSKARHVQWISGRLGTAGLTVPVVLAVGEDRRGPLVRAAWVATAALEGMPVELHLTRPDAGLAGKRATLVAVGRAVAELHDAEFVAGDLVPSNVWLVDERVAFLDHDRTVEGMWAARWCRARRNLVQLNRVVLPGVTMTDRLRVYRAYVARRGWTLALARRRLGWVVRKTVERRRRFDGVAPKYAASVSFRELMRAPRRRTSDRAS